LNEILKMNIYKN